MSNRVCMAAACGLLSVGILSSAAKAVVLANFEDGTTDGFGYLSSSSGVKSFPASPGPTVTVLNPSTGDTTKVLDVNGAGYNGGQSGGADVGYDFASNGNASTFLADDILSFDWEAAPISATGGYSQIYQVVLNAPGLGYTTIGGVALADNSSDDQNPPFSGQVHTISINYDQYKSQITANPGYLQLGIVTNNGGGASSEIYLDNFTLTATATPEPASLGLLGVGALGLLGRRRKA